MDAPILIVGGGPAGALTALQLARRGCTCEVLEAEPTCGNKPGETLPPSSSLLLRRLGLADLLDARIHLESHGNRFVWGDARPQEKLFFAQTESRGWHLDRARFERDLAERVRAAGVSWRTNCTVREVIPGSNWTVRATTAEGAITLNPPFLVDASGRRALVARACDVARIQVDRLVALVSAIELEREVARLTHIEAVADGWWYAAPVPGRRLVTVFFSNAGALTKALREPAAYGAALRGVASFQEILPEGELRPEPPLVRQAGSSYLNRVIGPNWLAVGDAAFAYDPISSHGITAALGAGFYAGNAIADHLAGHEAALPAYAHLQTQAYAQYLTLRDAQYALERRWPLSSFWLGD